MIIGQTLPCNLIETIQVVAYSEWFPRQGNAATFSCETIGLSGNVDFNVSVEHKNREDTDSGAALVAALPTASAVGITRVRATGLKHLIRYKYEPTITDESSFEWVHFRMLPPMWERNRAHQEVVWVAEAPAG